MAIYTNIENLVLWVRSETIGCAVNPAAVPTGMMEYWNIEFGEMQAVFKRMARIRT